MDSSLKGGDVEAAKEKLRLAIKSIDMASSKGVLHRNTAARRVSRLTKRVNRAAASASA